MQFIDKTLNQVQGNALVNAFLVSRWDAAISRYVLINYSGQEFRTTLKQPLKQLLLNEQNHLCCYCMRLITEGETTLEHIVPQSTTNQIDLDKYTHHQIIRDNVCLQAVYDNSPILLTTAPYPLEIAYENLTASCKGDFFGGATYHICNHKRGSSLIEPLFYINTINSDITYGKGGLLVPANMAHNTTIMALNLNYNSLENIRQIWYHFSAVSLEDIENANTELERNTLLTLNLMSLPALKRNKLIADFKTEVFWNVLLQYKWFHTYYLTQYPLATR